MGNGWERVWISRVFLFLYLLLISYEVFGGPTRPLSTPTPTDPFENLAQVPRKPGLKEVAPRIIQARLLKTPTHLKIQVELTLPSTCYDHLEVEQENRANIFQVVLKYRASQSLACPAKEFSKTENIENIPLEVLSQAKSIQILGSNGWHEAILSEGN